MKRTVWQYTPCYHCGSWVDLFGDEMVCEMVEVLGGPAFRHRGCEPTLWCPNV